MPQAHVLVAAAALAVAAFAAQPGGAQPGPPAVAQPPTDFRLAWPIACRLGTTCEIQHYIDHDPSPAVKDYACGGRTYDGHDGVDIRLPDMNAQRAGVAVLAAADGIVFRVRDGVADAFLKTQDRKALDPIGCGNAVVINHVQGFRTAYCHLAKGSVRVKPGDVVKTGQPIGRVGLSGLTDFPHLHFGVLQNGKTVDPFAYGAEPNACNGGRSLWAATPAYSPRAIGNLGFADAAPSLDSVEEGSVHAPGPDAGLVIAYARAIGLHAGDVQTSTLRGPDGAVLAQARAEALPHDQDLRLVFVGKRRPASGWPKGAYRFSYVVTDAQGRTVLSRDATLAL